MKCVHIADTHLGLSAFNKLDPESGMNLRERLVYDNFLAATRRILEERPDAIVHAGDLFHMVKPKTRAYTTVLAALDLIRDAGVPLILIAGNHSMTKTRYTQSPFAVLEYHGAEVHAAYRYRYEMVECGDTRFHLIPNMLDPAGYRHAFDDIRIDPSSQNVLVTHGLASMLKDHRLNTVAEHEIDAAMISDAFDYIALGHYHGQVQVAPNAWYSGSIEHCTYGEIDDTKGGLVVDTVSGRAEHLSLPKTPMLNLGTISCEGMSAMEAAESVAKRLEGITAEHAMAQITLKGLNREMQRQIARSGMRESTRALLDLRIRVESVEEERTRFAGDDLRRIDFAEEFRRFVQEKHLPAGIEEYALKKGFETLTLAMQRQTEADDASE
ncbi:metallophosphoesterase family protein [Methanofollis fontis]|uniref:Metallophosphoesterase n=1 Tax=Methanofollis fontis TaxID=2052832 RepID=A0A483CXZ1_9EURY|nr:metallophosphoesterase [Methanofollis fontis]TAJ44263.1 metallophosphoesterase [Methanofollis fontis]